MVRPSRVLQLAISVLQLTFVMPVSNGAPLTGWKVGYVWQSSPSTIVVDPAAGATIVTPPTPASGAAVNSTLNLTIPRTAERAGDVALLGVHPGGERVRRVTRSSAPRPADSIRGSAHRAHRHTPGAVTAPQFVTAINATQPMQSVAISYTAPPASTYYPSASMAMGYRVTLTSTYPAALTNGAGPVSVVSSVVTSSTSLSLTMPVLAATVVSVSTLIKLHQQPGKAVHARRCGRSCHPLLCCRRLPVQALCRLPPAL